MGYFATAFLDAGSKLLHVAGVLAALLLFFAGILAVILIASVAFDAFTGYLARRWKRRGKEPRTRIGRIIYAHADDL